MASPWLPSTGRGYQGRAHVFQGWHLAALSLPAAVVGALLPCLQARPVPKSQTERLRKALLFPCVSHSRLCETGRVFVPALEAAIYPFSKTKYKPPIFGENLLTFPAGTVMYYRKPFQSLIADCQFFNLMLYKSVLNAHLSKVFSYA